MMRGRIARQRESENLRAVEAFTLIEMLVVMAIIAIIAVIGLPSLRGLGKSNVITSATQQLVDDLMLARHKAIVNRTTVHVVFVAGSLTNQAPPPGLNTRDRAVWQRLRGGGFTTYALYAERNLGDQPGQPSGRYLTEWRSLPEGMFVATHEYRLPDAGFNTRNALDRQFGTNTVPFPSEKSAMKLRLPCVSFDESGRFFQLETNGRTRRYRDEYIELARGSVLVATNGTAVDINAREAPPGNGDSTNDYTRIRIDALSGRARTEQPEIAFGN